MKGIKRSHYLLRNKVVIKNRDKWYQSEKARSLITDTKFHLNDSPPLSPKSSKYWACLSLHRYLLTPLLEQDVTQGQFFKKSLTGSNSEFSFSQTGCHTKVKDFSLPYYLSIAGRRILNYWNQGHGKQDTWTSNLLNTEDQWFSSAVIIVHLHSQH